MNEAWPEVEMQKFVSNLTALLLIVHAMIGCCHHHWHRDDECCVPVGTVASCECCESHFEFVGANQMPPTPCDGDLECQGVCSYLPTPRTQLNDASESWSLELFALPPCEIAIFGCATTFSADWIAERDFSPPVRLNLLQR